MQLLCLCTSGLHALRPQRHIIFRVSEEAALQQLCSIMSGSADRLYNDCSA